jgi:hypothetical protein
MDIPYRKSDIYGGAKANTDAEVLNTNDVPMPELYAAGELTGPFLLRTFSSYICPSILDLRPHHGN